MSHQVKMTTTYAKNILSQNAYGQVHSVYNNTVNLLINGQLLALQTANSPLSPISLITDFNSAELAALSITTCHSVKIEQDRITLSSNENETIVLNLSEAEFVNLSPCNPMMSEDTKALSAKILQAINQSHTCGFDEIFKTSNRLSDSLILNAARNRITTAYNFTKEGNAQDAVQELSRLIGLGIGLTPSGDDFLCGLLAGLHLLGKDSQPFVKQLKIAISNSLMNTNEISQAFLKCALQNQYSFAVNQLWTQPDASTIHDMFLAIGHSSGIDTLCGIYYALYIGEII